MLRVFFKSSFKILKVSLISLPLNKNNSEKETIYLHFLGPFLFHLLSFIYFMSHFLNLLSIFQSLKLFYSFFSLPLLKYPDFN